MKLGVLTSMALVSGVLASTGTAAAQSGSERWVPDEAFRGSAQACGFPLAGPIQQFQQGAELRRQDAVNYLRAVAYGTPAPLETVQCAAARLRTHYAARSGRQQSLLDTGSGAVVAGAFGNLAGAGAGATTQTIWGYVGLAPVLLAEINANEPTRNLFYGATLALDLVNARYADVSAASATSLWRSSASAEVIGACERINALLANQANWNRSDVGALVAEDAKAAADACRRLEGGKAEELMFSQGLEAWKKHLARLYAADALLIESAVTSRDHELRYSPVETIKNLAAAPFQLVGGLISGDDGRGAVKALDTQRAFKSLNLRLSRIPGPPAPVALEALEPSSATRAQAVSESAPKPLRLAARETQAAFRLLARERRIRDYAGSVIARANTAAASNELKFNYDPVTERASVELAAPADTSSAVTPTTGG